PGARLPGGGHRLKALWSGPSQNPDFCFSCYLRRIGDQTQDAKVAIYRRFKAPRPAYIACCPSSSSIRSNWLYLAVRSDRASDPVLICPQLVATARSAMVESSVSPERCDITAV